MRDHIVDAFLQRTAAEKMDHHIARLSDTEGAVSGLILNGGIHQRS